MKKLSNKNFQRDSTYVMNENGEPVTSNEEQLIVWRNHFSNILNRPSTPYNDKIAPRENCLRISANEPTLAEVRKVIKSLKSANAAGPDNITPEIFKECLNTIANLIQPLIAQVWNNEHIPAE